MSDDDDFDEGPYPVVENPEVDDESTTPLELLGYNGCRGELAAPIARYMFEYQKEGVKWFYRQYTSGLGGILADDMGLGKTLQSVAFISVLLELTGNQRADGKRKRDLKLHALDILADGGQDVEEDEGPVFIVVQASHVNQWVEAVRKWTICNVEALGSAVKADDRVGILRRAKCGGIDVIVASVSIALALPLDAGPRSYRLVIIDEVHERFKNHKSKSTEQVENLVKRAKCVFGLSGTPLQNNLNEAYTLLSLCTRAPDLGDRKQFKEEYRAIEKGRTNTADREAQALGARKAEKLRELLAKYMLRREKNEVLNDKLEDKEKTLIWVELSPFQKKLYKAVVNMNDVRALQRGNDGCPCAIGRRDRLKRKHCCDAPSIMYPGGIDLDMYRHMPLEERRNCFFAATVHNGDGVLSCEKDKCPACYQLQVHDKLWKILNHPCLLQLAPAEKHDERKAELTRLFLEITFGPEELRRRGIVRTERNIELRRVDDCGKLAALKQLLEGFEKYCDTPKVLIFSQWTSTLDVIEAFVRPTYTYVRFDGSLNAEKRTEVVDKFNEDPDVYLALISSGAGGTGLNLQSANKVVIFDQQWNPASGEQSEDRAYRIGQQRKVSVYRLVAEGTMEEQAVMRQFYKKKITTTAFQGDKQYHQGARFAGIKGKVNGELFGNENLLQYCERGFLRDLRKKLKAKRKGAIASDDAVAKAGLRADSSTEFIEAVADEEEEEADAADGPDDVEPARNARDERRHHSDDDGATGTTETKSTAGPRVVDLEASNRTKAFYTSHDPPRTKNEFWSDDEDDD